VTAPGKSNPEGGAPAATAASGEAARKTKRLGDFELLSKLGQGAMGAVYLARQISKDRKVALKILPQDMARDDEFLERFRREARAAQKLSHPNIVAAYDVGVAENYHYIAMEYVDGRDLDTVLAKKGRFEEVELLKVAHGICSALEAAEEKGIVHRDIKPANILMNSEGVAKLIDMGLSSASQGDRRVTMAGFAVGTPYYISPEQARGTLDVDVRSDIYSFGATLYHLATGKLPFPGNNPVVIMTQHISEYAKPAHEREPAVSRHVSTLIQKMMEKDVAHRQQNARELKLDIEKCMRGETPVLAPIAEMPAKRRVPAAGSGARPKSRQDSKTNIPAAQVAPLGEQIDALLASALPFVPQVYRLAVAASALTILFFGVLLAVIIVLMRT
jgi:eukaryotic-like serine/threonine-protein kinase